MTINMLKNVTADAKQLCNVSRIRAATNCTFAIGGPTFGRQGMKFCCKISAIANLQTITGNDKKTTQDDNLNKGQHEIKANKITRR